MSNKEISQNNKSTKQEEIGRVHNEPSKRVDDGTEPKRKEVGVVKNNAPGKVAPSSPETGRTKNNTPGKVAPSSPETGRTKNEPPSRK
jgi:hypothetical protein